MPKLQLVILDYAKLTLAQNPSTAKYLADLVKYKQLGFEQTSSSYVVMDKHDMIGTHFMIYDTSDVHNPKLVLAIRNTYEDRANFHGLHLPINDYIDLAGPQARLLFDDLHKKVGSLVDCNSWFVDPNYSFKNTGLKLSEIAFLMATSFIVRRGHTHLVGATNEKFKASRWLHSVGTFPEGLQFIHPTVPDVHKVHLVSPFNYQWMEQGFGQYGDMLYSAHEILGRPDEIKPLETALAEVFSIDQRRAA